jgi:hypothetical protein
MPNLRRDLRFGLRSLRRSLAFTVVSVLSLAVGIGANTAIFSVIDALLLRDLPVKAPQELMLFENGRVSGRINTSYDHGFVSEKEPVFVGSNSVGGEPRKSAPSSLKMMVR